MYANVMLKIILRDATYIVIFYCNIYMFFVFI